MSVARARLAVSLTSRHCRRNSASSASGSRRLSREASRSQPSPIRSVRSRASGGLLTATKRRGVTPLVTFANFSGHKLEEIAQHRLGEQPGMQNGDAVHRVAADRREMRHPHGPIAALVDDRHA